ncbi:hypothetical protein VNO77_24224 [Canavalia gladiata]|uniref:Uncharacterized protein n=1 Tax=Canavalia gladiata TaxID=3824 RepID=A0AAN9L992_CANGL
MHYCTCYRDRNYGENYLDTEYAESWPRYLLKDLQFTYFYQTYTFSSIIAIAILTKRVKASELRAEIGIMETSRNRCYRFKISLS